MDYKIKTINISALCCGALIDGERSTLQLLLVLRLSEPHHHNGVAERRVYTSTLLKLITQINDLR